MVNGTGASKTVTRLWGKCKVAGGSASTIKFYRISDDAEMGQVAGFTVAKEFQVDTTVANATIAANDGVYCTCTTLGSGAPEDLFFGVVT